MNYFKPAIFVLVSLLLFSGCSRPMSYIHPAADLTYIKTVAIVPLKNLTQEKNAECKVMDVVAAEALRRGVFDVVEFGEVSKILRAEGFKEGEGIISKSVAERGGKRLNVQAFIVGSVAEYGVSRAGGSLYPEVSLSLKLVDARSYKILWEATHSLKGATVLDRLFGIGRKSPSDLCKELVVKMFDTLFGER
ncbi:MAG: hypothetical protein PF495_12655 [Spirochaetales bacterium]|jgi:hypothetical protein|nr:hypothetical protein [Spirochaetales bacterium]